MSSDPNTTAADGSVLPPLPADHLSHPEQWATGADPATSKQKGFIKVLEGQHPESVPEEGLNVEGMGKSEASEVIEKLKSGQKLDGQEDEILNKPTDAESAPAQKDEDQEGGKKVGEKRKVENVEDLIDTTITTKDKKTASDAKTSNATSTTTANSKTKKSAGDDDSAAQPEEEEDNDDAKDLKKTKQTTLDDTFGDSSSGEKKSTATSSTSTKKDDTTSAGTDRASKKPRLDESSETTTSTTAQTSSSSAPAANNGADDTIPGDSEHLDHPENWTTGDEPATDKQKGYLKVLEKQKGVELSADSGLGKSEASEKIEELKGL
nr:uncharacterized protein CI109_002459 [Kwoniella shandongensis]KAA5529118.1 hypothetical protein CI109_002459 [Kwoniella shandongensis]